MTQNASPLLESQRDDEGKLLQLCAGLQETPFILQAFDKELKALGFAGPTEIPQLVYLLLHTRFFDRPGSLLIKGPSSSGKSHALEAALKFVPEEVYEICHGISEKAIFYNEKLRNLQHRFLIIQEAAAVAKSEVGMVFIRQLLSEGKVRHMTVIEGEGVELTAEAASRLNHDHNKEFSP